MSIRSATPSSRGEGSRCCSSAGRSTRRHRSTRRPSGRGSGSPAKPFYRVDLHGAGHESYTDVCYYEDLVKAKPDAPAPLVQAIDDFAKSACPPKFLPIDTAHRLIDRYAIGFLERYVAGDAAAARWLKPTEPKIVSVRVKR